MIKNIISPKLYSSIEIIKQRRKTFSIAISANKAITIKAPLFMSNSKIEELVKKKYQWITKKLQQKQFHTKAAKFKNNELHYFLGQKYRLNITKSNYEDISIKNDQFIINSTNNSQKHIKELIYSFYQKKALEIFLMLFQECWNNFTEKNNYPAPNIKIKQVKTIWGSLSTSGNMTLNLELIKSPIASIKYIIFHELCHLKHQDHSKSFKDLLTKQMPDWKEHKKNLINKY